MFDKNKYSFSCDNNNGTTVTINGNVYSGRTVSITGDNNIIVDGKVMSNVDSKQINIEVHGDVLKIDTIGSVNVSGNTGTINTTGSVRAGGDVHGSINTTGSVSVDGKVDGSISTMGRVTVGSR